jgi:peptidyl-prolyl cis-trans isomerase C
MKRVREMVKNARQGLILLLAFTVAATACAQKSSSTNSDDLLGPGQVATVNGARIPISVFRLYVLAMKKDPDQLGEDERKGLVDDLVGLKLLEALATKEGVPEERTIAAQLELDRLQLLARAMVVRYLDKNPPSEQDLKKLYDESLPRLSATQYKARHILVSTEQAAKDVIAELKKGKDFGELAKERSTDPTNKNGGELGWFSADSMVKPFADAVRQLKVGSYTTQPVKTDFGFHVILLEDTRTPTPPTMDSVRQQLQAVANQQKANSYIKTIRDGAKVTYSENN